MGQSVVAPHSAAMMQRLYSMFPQGGPGVGLLLLRVSMVACMVWLVPADPPGWFAILAMVLGSAFVAGIATPVVCVASVALMLAMAGLGDRVALPALAVTALQAAALLLLGPGAYSLDALLFGRRLIDVKRRK